jgi:hypothetical protein
MKLFYCTILSCLFAGSLFAQEKKLLQNFKYRIGNYRAINLATDAEGIVIDENRRFGGKESSTSGFLNADLFNLRITDNKKSILQFGFQNNISNSKNNNRSAPIKSNSMSNGFVLNGAKTWFLKEIFLEAGTSIRGSFGINKTKDFSNVTISKLNNNFSNFSATFGIGKGRLENITDMQNALWLNKALQADKNLNRDLSEIELNNLGRAITKGNNTRILDFRKRNKFLLKTVDGFLQEKGVVKENNIDYFNNLNDILFFAFNSPRLAGSEIYFRATPEILGQDFNTSTYNNFPNTEFKNENNYRKNSMLFTTGYKKYTPKNLVHQNNFGAAIALSFNNIINGRKSFVDNIISSEYKNTDKITRTSLDLFYEHSIFPNTRTNLNFNVNTSLGVDRVNSFNERFASVNLGVNVNYFINYNTRFKAGVNALYNNNKTDLNNLNNFYYNNYQNFFLQSKVGLEINF